MEDIMTNEREKIGSRIKEIRSSQGLTQQDLADRCGITRTTISKIESGKFNLSIDLLNRILSPLNAEILIKEVE